MVSWRVVAVVICTVFVAVSCGGRLSDGPWEVAKEACGRIKAQPFLTEVMRDPVLTDYFDLRDYDTIRAYRHQEWAGWETPGSCEYFEAASDVRGSKTLSMMNLMWFIDEASAESFAVEFAEVRSGFELNNVVEYDSGAELFGQHLCVIGFARGIGAEEVESFFDEVHVEFAERHC